MLHDSVIGLKNIKHAARDHTPWGVKWIHRTAFLARLKNTLLSGCAQ